MKKVLLLLLLAPIAARSQTSFTIPVPDNKTITSTNNVWSCVASGAVGLPAGLTFANNVLTAPAISTASLTLTGGTSYPNGNYLVTFSSGTLTFTPYVPPTSTSTGTVAAGATYSVAVPQLAAFGLGFYPVNTAAGKQVVVATGQTVSITPSFTGNPQTALPNTFTYMTPALLVDKTNGLLWLRMGSGNNSVFPASTWTVSVH